MVAHPHKGHLGTLVLVGGGGALAWYLWSKNQAGAATSSTGAATTDTTGAALLAPYGVTASTPAASATSNAPVPVLVPAQPLNAPDTIVGKAAGTDIVTQTPAFTASGEVLPSNFAPIDDPRTGVQTPVQFVTPSDSPQVVYVPPAPALQPSTPIVPPPPPPPPPPPTVSSWLIGLNPAAADWVGYVNNSPDILAAYKAGDGKGATVAAFGQWHWANFGQREVLAGARSWTPWGPVPSGYTFGGLRASASLQGFFREPFW